ncbi:uncharacterized protein PG998_014650 [Apiospora kogelbergensis]|uniref:uncharacterized protein n=1 Tax=Apiospora kogelbergensis TaxID=1337665 RepID=UPI00312E39DE
MSSKYMIRIRISILFLTLLSLAIAILNSAHARFAVILRDRARSDYANTTAAILDNKFLSLQSNILIDTIITALAMAAILPTYATSQLVLAFVMIGTGGYLADQVQGFQPSFKRFSANDAVPYYSMMYYGGVAQAGYGSVLILFAITVAVFCFVSAHCEKKQERVEEAAREAAETDNRGRESSRV